MTIMWSYRLENRSDIQVGPVTMATISCKKHPRQDSLAITCYTWNTVHTCQSDRRAWGFCLNICLAFIPFIYFPVSLVFQILKTDSLNLIVSQLYNKIVNSQFCNKTVNNWLCNKTVNNQLCNKSFNSQCCNKSVNSQFCNKTVSSQLTIDLQ